MTRARRELIHLENIFRLPLHPGRIIRPGCMRTSEPSFGGSHEPDSHREKASTTQAEGYVRVFDPFIGRGRQSGRMSWN